MLYVKIFNDEEEEDPSETFPSACVCYTDVRQTENTCTQEIHTCTGMYGRLVL